MLIQMMYDSLKTHQYSNDVLLHHWLSAPIDFKWTDNWTHGMVPMIELISVEKTLHKNNPRLKFLFERDEHISNALRSIRYFSRMNRMGCWHIPYYDNYLTYLKNSRFNEIFETLLGHSSSKTKEIYTHIISKGLQNLRSPLNQMNV